jgi:hypothetical protein
MRRKIYDHFPKSGLVKQYEPFIKKWCGNFAGQYPHLEMADILSDAVAIAFEAEKKFKPELGYSFRFCQLGDSLCELRSGARYAGPQARTAH